MSIFKRHWRLLCALLACVILLSGIGVVYYHGEWWFPRLMQLTRRGEVDLTVQADMGETTHWSYADLVARDDVIASDVLRLVNADYPLPTNYEPTLIEYNGAKMHPLMQDSYIALRDDVQAKTNVRIYVASDYRTPEEQAEILASADDGVAAAVGCSEHEAGLALDVYAPYHDGMDFLRSPAGRAVNRTCHEYGFIVRYPYGKADVTGISYEPWHLRYVGKPHAEIMALSGLTMEEYIESLTPEAWYAHGDYLISRRSIESLDLPNGWTCCEISPDNTGYYIVTLCFSN